MGQTSRQNRVRASTQEPADAFPPTSPPTASPPRSGSPAPSSSSPWTGSTRLGTTSSRIPRCCSPTTMPCPTSPWAAGRWRAGPCGPGPQTPGGGQKEGSRPVGVTQWLPWGVKKPLEMCRGERRGRVLVPWAGRSGSSWPGHTLALAFPASAVFPPPGVTRRPSHPPNPRPGGPRPSPCSFLRPSFLLFLSKPSRFGVTTRRCRSGSFQSFPSPASPPEVPDREARPPCSCPSLLLILGVIGLPGDPDILNKTWRCLCADEWPRPPQSPTANSLEGAPRERGSCFLSPVGTASSCLLDPRCWLPCGCGSRAHTAGTHSGHTRRAVEPGRAHTGSLAGALGGFHLGK